MSREREEERLSTTDHALLNRKHSIGMYTSKCCTSSVTASHSRSEWGDLVVTLETRVMTSGEWGWCDTSAQIKKKNVCILHIFTFTTQTNLIFINLCFIIIITYFIYFATITIYLFSLFALIYFLFLLCYSFFYYLYIGAYFS